MNLTENSDYWGLPIEERIEKPKPMPELIDKKKQSYEAHSFFEGISGQIGGWLMEVTESGVSVDKIGSMPGEATYQVVYTGKIPDVDAFGKSFERTVEKDLINSIEGLDGVEVLVVKAEESKLELQVTLRFDPKMIDYDVLEKSVTSAVKGAQ